MSILNETHPLESTLEYNDKGNNSFLNSTDCSMPNVSISTVAMGCPSSEKVISNQENNGSKSHIHFNRLWSVWYGILVTLFQGYLIALGVQKYIGCSLLTWKNGLPVTELNMQLIFCGLTLLFLPLFMASALFKIGNLANDGVKLSAKRSTCSSDPPVFEDDGNNSTMRALWMHGMPISVFIHFITAICLLLPHLLLEAKLIQNQHLPKDNIWKSEVDFILNRSDRLVILSFINTSPYQNDTGAERGFDNSVESLDYDLNPFDTHENLQVSQHLPTEEPQLTLNSGGSSAIQISTYDDDDDEYYLSETTTSLKATSLRMTTFKFSTTTSTITSTISSTTIPLPTTIPTTTNTATEAQTIEQNTLPTFITVKSTLPSYTLANRPTWTNSPIVTEKTNHGKNRNHKNNRKHNHRKHHKQPPPISELDETDEKNQEFRMEDFDIFDKELTSKKKNKNVSKSSNEHARSTPKNTELFERSRTTQKTGAEIARSTTVKPKVQGIDSQVKHETTAEYLIPSIATSTIESKIVDIKQPEAGTLQKIIKRSVDDALDPNEAIMLLDNALPSINEDTYIVKDDFGDHIQALALVGTIPNLTQTAELEGLSGFLQNIFGPKDNFEPKQWFQKSPSLEYVNLALALLVWSVRYPSVFWESSKAFSMIFSLQMIANSIDILMLHVGTSILFKLQVVGQFMTVQNQPSPLLLNGIVTLALTLLAYVLIVASSMILYLYGHSRLAAKIRDCQMITLKDGDIWSYFSHCASLCFILALSVVKAPIIHDLSVTYRISLDGTIFGATITSIIHIFLWIVVWLALTAKRRWAFKLPVMESIYQTRVEAIQPLLTQNGRQISFTGPKKEEETIYWPSSPKLKVTFDDEVPSTLNDHNLIDHNGKRPILSTLRSHAGEADEGEYATLKNNIQLLTSEYEDVGNLQRLHRDNGYDDTSEEGKLMACMQDESVTYASTKDLEPPQVGNSSIYERFVITSEQQINPLAPVTVQVHSEHITSTPRFLRRADSGMPPNEALTPKSDTNSTESSTSPPERALSESSSGVHSGEENKDEVVIRSRPIVGLNKVVKTPAVIQEEPYGRITNMRHLSSFKDTPGSACNTLPVNRGLVADQTPVDYACSTMPIMPGVHHINRMSANDSPKQRTTLPSNIRYSTGNGNGHFLRQMSQLKNAESPYATGLGSGHHTFSTKFIQSEPLPPPPQSISQSQSQQQFCLTSSSIHQIHHFNTSSSSFAGINSHPYQMVVNELCANNQTPSFPPPPPPIAH